MNQLVVTANTTIVDLQNFANNAGDKNIRAKTVAMEDGGEALMLYVSDKRDRGIRNFFTHHSDKREAKGRAAVEGFFKNLANDAKLKNGNNFDNLMQLNVLGKLGTGTLQGTKLATLANDAFNAIKSDHQHALEALAALKDNSKLQSFAASFGQSRAASFSPKMAFDFTLGATGGKNSFQDSLLKEWSTALGSQGQAFNANYADAPSNVKQLVDAAVKGIAANLPDRMIDDQTLYLNNKKCTFVKDLADVSNCKVSLFNDADAKPVVVKQAKQGIFDHAERHEEAAHEVQMHEFASKNNPMAVGFVATMLAPNQLPAIAMEYAPNGDVGNLIENLSAVSSQLDPSKVESAKLTLAMDMASAIKELHDRGMIHEDLKPGNFFVNAEGKPIASDFGTVHNQPVHKGVTRSPVESPYRKAPEIIHGEYRFQRQHERSLERAHEKNVSEVKDFFARNQVPDSALQLAISKMDNYLNQLVKQYESFEGPGEKPFDFSQSADVWSLGATFYELEFQRMPFKQNFQAAVESEILEFRKDHRNRIIKPGDGHGPNGTFTEFENLINKMMHPVPEERPTLKEVLDDPAFKSLGVGTTQTRAMIKAIAEGKQTSDINAVLSDPNLNQQEGDEQLKKLSALLA